MTGTRHTFDASLPARTSAQLMAGGRSFATDEVLPWLELGMSEADLFAFWQSGLVYFLPAPPLPLAAPAVSPPVTVQRAEEPALRRRR